MLAVADLTSYNGKLTRNALLDALVEVAAPQPGGWLLTTQLALCERVAAAVAGRAGRNYLITTMAAVPLSTADHPVDPAAADLLGRKASRSDETV